MSKELTYDEALEKAKRYDELAKGKNNLKKC